MYVQQALRACSRSSESSNGRAVGGQQADVGGQQADEAIVQHFFCFLTITKILLNKIALTREGEYDI